MIDYHIHTCHSIDAEGSIEEYCRQALKCGLKEICITNHCELDPQRNDNFIKFANKKLPLTRDGLVQLQNQILQVRKHYTHLGLTIKFGLEVGYYEGIEHRLQEVVKNIDFDFWLGSIHCLNHICIDSHKECTIYFSKYSVSELLENYFYATQALVNSQLFDSVGHLDVYKKYGLQYYGENINNVPEDLLRKSLELMREKEIALEINTAGLRRIGEFYPAPNIMKLARELGLKMITIGSDAHKVEDLGKGIKEVLAYVKSFGFDAVYGFEKRKPVKIKI